MVGLPARGKTYTARKIARYLTWLGHRSKIFNVGNYRRKHLGAQQTAHFFDPTNEEFAAKRAEVAQACLIDMITWITMEGTDQSLASPAGITPSVSLEPPRMRSTSSQGGAGVAGPSSVAIYDATNSSKERRQLIYSECTKAGVKVFFVENTCDDEDIVMKNILEVKLSSPDYVDWDEQQDIVADFKKRIAHYERAYETLSTDELGGKISFVKVLNIGKQVSLNLVQGYLESRIVYFIMNLNTASKNFYISRHGESQFNVSGKIGGNSDLSLQGALFAEKLPSSIFELIPEDAQMVIWTSTLKRFVYEEEKTKTNFALLNRTIQTSQNLPFPKLQWKQLDELSSGSCDGLTYEEIEKQFPLDFAERDNDKFNYRYHGGESYRDLVHRLEPVILELERYSDGTQRHANLSPLNHSFRFSRHREEDTLIYIIAHQAVVRAIYAYFHGISHDELPYVKIPLHTIIKLTPKAYKCLEERIEVPVPAVDTFRPRKN